MPIAPAGRPFCSQYRKEIRGLTHRTQIWLSQRSWPGNVRELENVIGCAAMMTTSDMIDVQDLPPYLQIPAGQREHAAASIPPRPGFSTSAVTGCATS
ncbi:MAG TPA: hypothetical protein VME17_05260 [Bryobacteraceae bacterium]|nr:hypothetical protein [Bryobacteraceae bacterium]